MQHFQDFCRFSQFIEVLKLDCDEEGQDQTRASSLAWNNQSWKSLSKLRSLFLQAALIGLL